MLAFDPDSQYDALLFAGAAVALPVQTQPLAGAEYPVLRRALQRQVRQAATLLELEKTDAALEALAIACAIDAELRPATPG